MQIRNVRILPDTLDKLIWKHQVTEDEVLQVFRNKPLYRFYEKGKHIETSISMRHTVNQILEDI